VAEFFRSVGYDCPAVEQAQEVGHRLLDQWLTSDGWYSDGPNRAFDYYNAWSMHFYPVLQSYLAGTANVSPWAARLSKFLSTYQYFFGSDGAPVYYGRSLTYRFAVTAPLWLGALLDASPLPPATTRRIGSRCLEYFLTNGAVSGGLLSLGWHGPDRSITQRYSGPASPYWAAKGFVALLLPADHPVWTAPEGPPAGRSGDCVIPIPSTGLLLQATDRDGVVRLHNHGLNPRRPQAMARAPDDPLYARLSYSTRTRPVAGTRQPDATVGLVVRGRVTERGEVHTLGVGDNWAASRWFPVPHHWRTPSRIVNHPRLAFLSAPRKPLAGVSIIAVTLAYGSAEVHVSRVIGAEAGTRIRVSGWAVHGDETSALVSELIPLIGLRAVTATSHARLAHPAGVDATVVMPIAEGLVSPATDGDIFVHAARLSACEEAPLTELVTATLSDTGVLVTWQDGKTQHVALRPSQPGVHDPTALLITSEENA